MDGLTPAHMWACLIGLSRLLKKKRRRKKGREWRRRREKKEQEKRRKQEGGGERRRRRKKQERKNKLDGDLLGRVQRELEEEREVDTIKTLYTSMEFTKNE